MGIFKTMKMLNTINKGVDMIEDLAVKNKDKIEKAKIILEEIKTAIAYFESRKEEMQSYINTMKKLITRIKEVIGEE